MQPQTMLLLDKKASNTLRGLQEVVRIDIMEGHIMTLKMKEASIMVLQFLLQP